jgi:protein prenyltransferase alpha subunit repeat containing protein 1
LGYIHPSQFATLTQESASDDAIGYGGTTFWSRDHKLGISTQIILPLYNAAKRAFISAMEDYKSLGDNDVVSGERVGSEVMKQSKAVLLLSSDFGTAWNSRKLVVSKKQDISVFLGELQLSALVLSCSPKCDHAWSHR